MIRFKRIIALSLTAACLLMSLTGCGTKEDNNSSSGEERTKLVVGFDAEYPPYGYMDPESGDYIGFDLDLAAEVCARKGWELVKNPINWNAKDMELNSGAIDCIWNGFTINGREDDYTWSDAYVDNSQVVIVKADSGISDLNGLADKIVLVQADSAALAALESEELTSVKESFKELTQVADYNSALMTLESGAADAVALDKVVAQYYIKDRENTFSILSEELSSEQYGIGFKKGNEALRDEIQSVLYDMLDDGKFEEIATKWDQQDVICLKRDK